jgi:hypothetical protein
VCAGGLAFLSSRAQAKWIIGEHTFKDLLANGLEDTMQAAVGSTIGYAAGKVQAGPQTEEIPHPQDYQNKLLEHFNQEMIRILKFISYQREEIRRADLSRFEAFDDISLEGKLKAYLRQLESRPGLQPVFINEAEMAEELEIGIWAKWCSLALVRDSWLWGKFHYPGEKIVGHLHKKGIVSSEDARPIGAWPANVHKDQLVAETLYKWGKNWRPKRTFGGDPLCSAATDVLSSAMAHVVPAHLSGAVHMAWSRALSAAMCGTP